MKTAIITGGSGSIGSALVAEFAKDYRVIFTYFRNKEGAEEIAEKYGAEAVLCDITEESHIKNLLERVTTCHLLINNAGISSIGLFTDLSDAELDKMINTDLTSAMKLSKSVLPLMINQKQGCIINISSIWGVYGGSCETAYSAAKAGLIGFTKALSSEVGYSGVRVNCIAPGFIESEMNSRLSPEEVEVFIESTSLGKIGKPAHVAHAARYLSEAEYVTGQILGVDGGFR